MGPSARSPGGDPFCMAVETIVEQLHDQKDVSEGSAPPITNRFLFVNVAAMRARQLHRGAAPRLDATHAAMLEQGKAERIAMEEVRSGLVEYTPESSLAAWRTPAVKGAVKSRRCEMPVYEYVCRDCEKTFEMRRPMAEATAENVKCPSCGSARIERIYSSVYAKTSKKS